MSRIKRKFSKEDKLKILEESETYEVKVTLGKYGVYPATLDSGRKKCDQMGEKDHRNYSHIS
jgi:transposase-like protein